MSGKLIRAGRSSRAWWQLAGAIVVLALVGLGTRIATTGVSIDTDIQTILPHSNADPGEIAAIRHASAAAAARIVIGVTGGDANTRQAGAKALENQLTATGIFVPAAADLIETAAWIRANRYEISCAASAGPHDATWGAALAQNARVTIYSGMVPLTGVDLTNDPFLLDLHHLSCLSPEARPTTDAQVAGRLTASPFALATQDQITDVIDEWQKDKLFADLTLLRSGAVFFADAAGAQAKREITLVGGISIILIVLLYLTSFRAIATAGLALSTVAAGAIGGALACFTIFGDVHFSVFVFGSALTGVSADYAVHTFAARRAQRGQNIHAGQSKLRRALTISMLTSAAGFGALLVFDIVLFMQIGVFAMGGLGTAWLFAITILPEVDKISNVRTAKQAPLLTILHKARARLSQPALRMIAVGVVAAISFMAFPRIDFVDDLRQFQTLSPTLKAEQDALFPVREARFSTQFLMSSGDDLEAAQIAQERALVSLGATVAQRFITYSRFDPSPITRKKNRLAYQTELFAPHLAALQAELGLPQVAQVPAPNDGAPRPAWFETLTFEHGNQSYLLAPMLEGQEEIGGIDGAKLVDPAHTYGGALAQYRASALRVFGVAVAFAALVLALVNRQARAALLVAPPVMGCALALALPALLGVPITLFSILALFIVLGAGIDFSVFQWEMGEDQTGWTGAAVVIAALSTCAAMGMLGFSATLPIQTFGLTIAIGVLGAMVFSFMTPHPKVAKG